MPSLDFNLTEVNLPEICEDCGFRVFADVNDLDEEHMRIREIAVLHFPNELSQMEKREYTCKRCKVHGVTVKLKGHKKDCPWQHCKCPGCSLVVAYREEHARDQFELRQSERSAPEPATLSAAEVIQIANVSQGRAATGPTSISAKLRQKQVSRGVRNKDLYHKLNRSMEEYAKESPGIHPMLHMRKAILGATKEKPRLHREGKYTFVDTSMYKGYGRPAGESAAGSSRSSLPFVDSDEETSDQGDSRRSPGLDPAGVSAAGISMSPLPFVDSDEETSDQGDSRRSRSHEPTVERDVKILDEMFPAAKDNLGLSMLRDIRQGTPNMEAAIDQLISILHVPSTSPAREAAHPGWQN
ncbi:hypothetical protein Bbelb_342690 [Branchiostoma belcheri]|nr:hypothetical protein Bbelb_342690 [Branchiostoma belcheri]